MKRSKRNTGPVAGAARTGGEPMKGMPSMKTKTIAAVWALLSLGVIAAPAFAEDNPTGLPDNPNTVENVIPGPNATNPTDPSAADSAAARVPTTRNDAAHY